MENNYLKYVDDELFIENVAIADLATKYGTPLYVMSESFLNDRLTMMRRTFLEKYENVEIIYASKALSLQYMYKLLDRFGFGVDVCSDGEIFTAIKAGINPETIYFHGSNKTWEEIEVAIKSNVGTIIIDNIDEIVRVSTVAQQLGRTQDVLVRIVPQIKAGESTKIQTGNIGQKFGVQTHDNSYIDAINMCISDKSLNFRGIHAHIGSQIHDLELFKALAETMMNFVETIKEETEVVCEMLDIGGGFGIEYANSKELLPFDVAVSEMMLIIDNKSKALNINRPKIIIEPGRFIVGPAGVTIYNVTGVKEIKDVKTFVHVDGGMTDNIRPSLYDAKYDVLAANKSNEKRVVSIAGHGCETGDVLAENIEISKVVADDLIVFLQTGAYNYSMASNYNSMRKPAIVVVSDKMEKLIVKRESYDQLIQNEIDL